MKLRKLFVSKKTLQLYHDNRVMAQTCELFRPGLAMTESDMDTLKSIAHDMVHQTEPNRELEEAIIQGLRLVVINAFELVNHYREGHSE